MTFMLIHIKYRWGTWVYRRGWPGSRGWSRPTGNTCGACSSKWRSFQEDGKFKDQDGKEREGQSDLLRHQGESKEKDDAEDHLIISANKQTSTNTADGRWESLDIFWVSIEGGNSWVGDVFPNLGNNFARHPDHFSSQLVSSRSKKVWLTTYVNVEWIQQ